MLKAAGFESSSLKPSASARVTSISLDVADTVLAVVAPGLGDEIQAMKAGVLEVAHIVVVNKGDHAGAEAALRDLQEWYPRVLARSP